jgi:pilus assembly protein Flp/PilA
MKNFLMTFMRDDSGASAAEYALILAIVGIGIAGAALALAVSIQNAMEEAASTIDSSAGL